MRYKIKIVDWNQFGDKVLGIMNIESDKLKVDMDGASELPHPRCLRDVNIMDRDLKQEYVWRNYVPVGKRFRRKAWYLFMSYPPIKDERSLKTQAGF